MFVLFTKFLQQINNPELEDKFLAYTPDSVKCKLQESIRKGFTSFQIHQKRYKSCYSSNMMV